MRSPDYTRIAATLPALYQDDAASFAQVDAFLGLADDLNEAVAQTVEDLTFGLGPDAGLRWPDELPLDAGRDALMAELTRRYDELAQWFAFEVPSSWGNGETGVAARREFLSRAARLWRRRGTPRGFVDWFCEYFAITEEAARPFLLEHFKVPGGLLAAEAYTATLFVPQTEPFHDYRRRLEAAQFARWYAPAHVSLRVCYIDEDVLDTLTAFTAPLTLDPGANPDQVWAYGSALALQAQELRELACSVVSVVDHANGIHIYGCIKGKPIPGATERSVDHLDIGKLPTTGIDE